MDDFYKKRCIYDCGITRCDINGTTIGRSVPASGDFLEAVFFIFPEELYDQIIFSNIKININLDSVKKDQMEIINKKDGMIIIQPLFFGRNTIEYPIVSSSFTEGIKVGLTFSSELEDYGESHFKLGILYQQIVDQTLRGRISSERYDMYLKTYGNDNRIIFINGFLGVEKISLLEGEYSSGATITDPYVNPVNQFAIPYRCLKKIKEEGNEFDDYVPSNVTNYLIESHPINSPGYFNPNIKKAI